MSQRKTSDRLSTFLHALELTAEQRREGEAIIVEVGSLEDACNWHGPQTNADLTGDLLATTRDGLRVLDLGLPWTVAVDVTHPQAMLFATELMTAWEQVPEGDRATIADFLKTKDSPPAMILRWNGMARAWACHDGRLMFNAVFMAGLPKDMRRYVMLEEIGHQLQHAQGVMLDVVETENGEYFCLLERDGRVIDSEADVRAIITRWGFGFLIAAFDRGVIGRAKADFAIQHDYACGISDTVRLQSIHDFCAEMAATAAQSLKNISDTSGPDESITGAGAGQVEPAPAPPFQTQS